MAIERSDMKFTELPVAQYDGYARNGELVVDVLTDPNFPALYLGNVNHRLNLVGKPSGGLIPGGGTIPNAINTTTAVLVIGDLKQSFLTADHAGWILLDGRSVTTLTATQQAAAAYLGFTTTIPNATGRVLKQTGGVVGTIGGSSTATLSATNIPLMTGPAITTVFRKEVAAAVGDPVLVPNMIDIKSGNTPVNLVGSATVGTASPAPFSIEDPYMTVNTFLFLGA